MVYELFENVNGHDAAEKFHIPKLVTFCCCIETYFNRVFDGGTD